MRYIYGKDVVVVDGESEDNETPPYGKIGEESSPDSMTKMYDFPKIPGFKHNATMIAGKMVVVYVEE